MNVLDIPIFLIIIGFFYFGLKSGFVAEFIQFIGIASAFFLAVPLAKLFGSMSLNFLSIDENLSFFISGIFSFILVFLAVMAIGSVVKQDEKEEESHNALSKIFGGLLAIGKSFLIISLIVFVFRNLDPYQDYIYDNIKHDSYLIKELQTKIASEDLAINDPDNLANDAENETGLESYISSQKKSKFGYLTYKVSTLLDPISEKGIIYFKSER